MTYDVASAEARSGRRGLLDSGPHAPERATRVVRPTVAAEDQDEVYAATLAQATRQKLEGRA